MNAVSNTPSAAQVRALRARHESGRRRRGKLDLERRSEILTFAYENPQLTLRELGEKFGITAQRICAILNSDD